MLAREAVELFRVFVGFFFLLDGALGDGFVVVLGGGWRRLFDEVAGCHCYASELAHKILRRTIESLGPVGVG